MDIYGIVSKSKGFPKWQWWPAFAFVANTWKNILRQSSGRPPSKTIKNCWKTPTNQLQKNWLRTLHRSPVAQIDTQWHALIIYDARVVLETKHVAQVYILHSMAYWDIILMTHILRGIFREGPVKAPFSHSARVEKKHGQRQHEKMKRYEKSMKRMGNKMMGDKMKTLRKTKQWCEARWRETRWRDDRKMKGQK